jgi:hypothetical protein
MPLIAPGIIYLDTDASGGKRVTLEVTDLEGNPTSGVDILYKTSHPRICSIDFLTGSLYPHHRGIVKVTGYGYRGRYIHKSSKIIIIGESATDDTGDFKVKLEMVEPVR